MIEAVSVLLGDIYVRLGNKGNRQVLGMPIGTNRAPSIADLFLYYYESQFMTKPNKDTSTFHLIGQFNNTYRYLDDIFA